MAHKKMGRPVGGQPKDRRIFIRVDEQTEAKLDECTEILKITRSDVVRKGIDKIHDGLK